MARCALSLGYATVPKTGPRLGGLVWLVVVSLVTIVNAVGANNVVLVNDQERPSRGVNPTTRAALQLFDQHCAACHGGDGRGLEASADFPTIPNFADSLWQRSRSDAQLAATILNGRGDGMPPFSDDLTRSQVLALIEHIRSLALESHPSPAPRSSQFAWKYAQLKQEWDMLARELAELESRVATQNSTSYKTGASAPRLIQSAARYPSGG